MVRENKRNKGVTRRGFIKGAAAASVAVSVPIIGRRAFARPTKQELVVAWDASGTRGWDFHKFAMKTQEKGLVVSCYNGLIEWDKRKADVNLLMPGLAYDWDVSKDGMEWIFKLREGVRWHKNYGVDWGEFTSEDAEFSLNRGKAGREGSKEMEFIKEFKAIDRYTFKVTLKRPTDRTSVMGVLSNYHSAFIVCKKAIEQLGTDYPFKPVGTGIMKLNKYVPNTYSEWVAHERHFRGRPMLDLVRHMYMKDVSSREMAFQKDEVQMMQGILSQKWYEHAAELRDAEPIVLAPGLIAVIHINTTKEPFNNKKVRQAFMHAIDREVLRNFIGKDITKRQDSPVPHDYLGSTRDIKVYEYNPDKARRLLEEAGYPKGFETEMVISEIDDYLRPLQVIQGMLKKVGIKLGLKVVTHTAYHKMTKQDVNPLVIYGCSRFPTAQQILEQFYHSKSIVGTPTGWINFSHFAGVDKELDAAKVEVDVNKKIKLWEEVQRKVMEEAVALPLYIYMQCWAKKKWVDLGYEFTSNLEYSPLLSEKTRILPH